MIIRYIGNYPTWQAVGDFIVSILLLFVHVLATYNVIFIMSCYTCTYLTICAHACIYALKFNKCNIQNKNNYKTSSQFKAVV